MSSGNSIAEATLAVLELLNGQCPRDLFPQAMFAAYQPDDFTSPMEEGVSLYLFQVDLEHHLQPAPDPAGVHRRPALKVSYLMTAWSPDPLRQQQILGWALDAVQGNAVLGQQGTMEILPLTIADMAAVWSMARASAQPSVAIIVREIA